MNLGMNTADDSRLLCNRYLGGIVFERSINDCTLGVRAMATKRYFYPFAANLMSNLNHDIVY